MPVQYSYTSTPPIGHTACTEPQCLYSTAIPLLPLLAIRPVQSLSVCTVQLYLYSPYGSYGLYRASVSYKGALHLHLYTSLTRASSCISAVVDLTTHAQTNIQNQITYIKHFKSLGHAFCWPAKDESVVLLPNANARLSL